ncbi:ribonuclease Y [bacterium]|nr:ribonuclease Y [bacterium]
MTLPLVVSAVIAAAAGLGVGYWLQQQFGRKTAHGQEERITEKLAAAKEKLADLKSAAETEAREIREKGEKELDERRQQIIELEKRVADRENSINGKQTEFEKHEQTVKQQLGDLDKDRAALAALRAEEETKLAEIAGLTQDQASARVLELAEERTKEDVLRRVHKLEQEGEQQLKEKGKMILVNVIQRYGASQVSEYMSSHVNVPDESMIGRIIGKEGRNIQHLERVTGCEIVVDEAPNTIMVTGFSPLRRQVAKTAIERLVKDGRIHPGRIEGIVDDAKKQINDDIRVAGEAALYELNIIDFPEKLVHLVGRLKYRTSYSQNMLSHSIEVAHVATMLAEELGADVDVTKKAALLHDIGKAIDHDVEGTHVEVGDKIMRKFGLSEAVINAANPHDEGYVQRSVEAIIVQVADAVSAARPGARRESLEQYVKRMEDLENIATSYEGVDKCYAIHAGREVRVFVYPDQVDDLEATKIAQQIAKQIESELQYPGDVKVNVIRETRTEAVAR